MRVLFLSSGLADSYGGAAISEASLARQLALDHSVEVLCRVDRLEKAFSQRFGLSVTPFTPFEVAQAWSQPKHWIVQKLRAARVFHLNGHWFWENYLFARLCSKYRIPYVAHPRGMLVLNERRPVLKRIFNLAIGNEIVRNASKVIALSRYEVNQFASYGIDPDKIEVIPNGIPIPKGTHRPEKADKKYFLYLGRISRRKNLGFLIDAYAEFLKTSEGDRKSLFLVGPEDRSYGDELRSLIERHRLADSVRLLPAAYETEKWRYLAAATAVIYPATDEAFGRVPFETVVSGSFPIVPVESGGAEYLSSFLPFCAYRQGDKTSLIEAMTKVSTAGEEERAALARAFQWVSNELTWEKVANRIVAIYQASHGEGEMSDVQGLGELERQSSSSLL